MPTVTSPPVQRYRYGTRPSKLSRRVMTSAGSISVDQTITVGVMRGARRWWHRAAEPQPMTLAPRPCGAGWQPAAGWQPPPSAGEGGGRSGEETAEIPSLREL